MDLEIPLDMSLPPILKYEQQDEPNSTPPSPTEGSIDGIDVNAANPAINLPLRRATYRRQPYLDRPPDGPGEIIPPSLSPENGTAPPPNTF